MSKGQGEGLSAFVRARRDELGLSQGQICETLNHVSRNAVSSIEVGIEGLPAKRAYALADILQVHRDAFFRFVTGEADSVEGVSMRDLRHYFAVQNLMRGVPTTVVSAMDGARRSS